MSFQKAIGTAIFCALTAVAVANCAMDDEILVDIDPDCTAEQANIIYAAGDRWNQVAKVKIVFKARGDHHVVLGWPGPGYDGLWKDNINTIFLRPDMSPERLLLVATHEFGHMLGLEHTKRGLMTPMGEQLEFSNEDLAECRRVGAC